MNLDSKEVHRLSVPRRKCGAVVDLVRGPLPGGLLLPYDLTLYWHQI